MTQFAFLSSFSLFGLLIWLAIPVPARSQWAVNGVPLCAAPNMQLSPVLAPDGAGGAIVCWTDGRGGYPSSDLYAQRVDNMGRPQWAANGISICTAPGSQSVWAAMADGHGGAVVTWEDRRSGPTSEIYAQRINSSGAPQWLLNGVPICTAGGDQSYPSIVTDSADGVIIVWEDERGGGGGELFMQRVDPDGNVLWTSNGITVCSLPSDKGRPVVVSDHAGGAFISWDDNRSDETGPDIYVQHVDNAGVAVWNPEGVAVCTAGFLQWSRGIVPDDTGGAIAVWDDCRATWFGDCYYSDIYAQRVNAAGETQWADNGLAVTFTLPYEGGASVVSDGEGGAIVSWDWEFDDILAQRLSPAGTFLWQPSGVPVCTVPGYQYNNILIADGVGGAIVAWMDYTNGQSNEDIHAGRISASGQLLWGPEGIAIGVAPRDQQRPAMVSDGWGGAIVAWQDNRAGVNMDDIYAQRVTGSGSIPTAVRDAGPPAFAVSEFAPNPLSNRATMQLILDRESVVTLQIYDAAGRLIGRSRGNFTEGPHQLEFDGTDGNGHRLPSGVYFARVTVDGSSTTRKMVIVR